MDMRFTAALIGFLCFGLAAAGSAQEKILLDGPAAFVNEDVITVGDVLMLIEPVRRRLSARYKGDELESQMRRAYREALTELIERRLILGLYEKRKDKMNLPDWTVQERINRIVHENFDGDQARLLEALARDGMTYEEWRDEIRKQIVIASMRNDFIGRRVNVSPNAVRDHYEQHRESFNVAEEVKLRMIVLEKRGNGTGNEDRRQEAAELAARLQQGEDFAAAAKTKSEGPHADNGGDWGWLEPKMLRAELASAALALAPGAVSDPIEVDSAFYIVKNEGHRQAGVPPFDAVRAKIREKLEAEQMEQLQTQWIARLKDEAYVQVLSSELFGEDEAASH